jgi:hypothetical protein
MLAAAAADNVKKVRRCISLVCISLDCVSFDRISSGPFVNRSS